MAANRMPFTLEYKLQGSSWLLAQFPRFAKLKQAYEVVHAVCAFHQLLKV
jgi:hypothetical protein